MKRLLRFVCFALTLGNVHAVDVTLSRLSPISGAAGTHAFLYGAGFLPGSFVQVNGTPASTINVQTNQLEFVIPAGASSGLVSLNVGGSWFTNPVAFTVTRQIPGLLNVANTSGYRIVMDGTFVPISGSNGTFTASVSVGDVDVLWAFKTANESAFMAMIAPTATQATINADSTAEALVLLNPLINGRTFQRYTNLSPRLRALPEFTELSSLIASISSAGRDYLDDAQFEDANLRAVQALIQSSSSFAAKRGGGITRFFESGTPTGTKLKYLNPPAGYFGYPDLRRIQSDILTPDTQHPDDYRLSFGSAGNFAPLDNPVDWFVKVYPLDAAQFPDGFNSVDALTHTNIPIKLSSSPIDTANVAASLLSKNLDVLDVVAGKLISFLSTHSYDQTENFTAPNEVAISALKPGIYVAESYSGNVYWGTELFRNSPPSQSQFLTSSGGRLTWGISLAGNVVVAAVDVVGLAGGFIPVYKNAQAARGINNDAEAGFCLELLDGVAQDVVKGLTIYGNQPLSTDVIYDFIKGAASSVVKNLAAKAMENGAELGIEEYGAKVLGTVGKCFDIAAKASTFLQVVERSTGLLGNSVLAEERSVLVVGDPFVPSLTSFFPTAGRGGEVLTIEGTHFSTDTNFLKAGFCQFAGTDNKSNITARIDLPIISVTSGSIAVRVPTNAASIFANTLRAYVFVESGTNQVFGTSAKLDPPFREFVFSGFPAIASAFPDSPRPGGMLELRGTGFDNFVAHDHQVLIDGSVQGYGFAGQTNRLVIALPQTITPGAHTLALKLRNFQTPAIPFQVQNPPYINTNSGQGYSIEVTKNDLSNAADGKISVLEGTLIAKGQLGRAIENHLPCEYLPPEDPDHCPYQEREIDHVIGDVGGAGIVDTVTFASSMIVSGALPALSPGDRFLFGTTSGTAVIFDGSSAGAVDGLLIDGQSGIYVYGYLVLRNFSGSGIHLRNGATNNYLENISIQNCSGHGVYLDGDASLNEFRHMSITNVTGHGIYLSGTNVRLNNFSSNKGSGSTTYDVIAACGGSGIRVDSGANGNAFIPGTIRNCGAAGIYVAGSGTANNLFGRESDVFVRSYDLVNNNGPGAYVGPGACGNVLRYLNPINNQGDGVLLEGPGCSNNVVDRIFAGANLYEGGTSITIGNQGSGIHLRQGAQFNLVGSQSDVLLGVLGSIVGNRDDGVLLEGADTAFNIVNSQIVGLVDPFAYSYQYSPNGLAGIALRNGAHDNTIGDVNNDHANTIFASLTAIEIANNGTDRNFVLGNQIDTYYSYPNYVVASGSGRCGNGIWIHNGPRGNVIGFAGTRIPVPHFPGDNVPAYYEPYNLIETCTNAGVLLENAGGTVGTDGILSLANVVQGNRIGELDNGNLAPAGVTGIKVGAGAEANVIGGPLPEQGNRIRGWSRAGIWIDQNNLSSTSMRNRFENNYVEGGVVANQSAYLTQTPTAGVGVLVTLSSGHTIGESLLMPNKLQFNRVAVYLSDSSSNTLRGFYITNNFNSGIAIRGGGGNKIGGGTVNDGNLVHACGINGAFPWSGIALSQTSGNLVRANEIGFLAPGRGSIGILLNDAFNNVIGGPAKIHGNYVISNLTNGIVLTGPATTGNSFFNNSIGIDRNGNALPNSGDGVRLEAGAHDNFIGGLAGFSSGGLVSSIPAGNVISANGGAGVRVTGATTVGNRILYNSITANIDKGIRHENGGNNLMPPPVFVAFDGSAISGTVADVGVTPPGSTIQIFSDPDSSDPEGSAFMGQAFVQSNGTWKATLTGAPRYATITMTATHGIDGSTSEFGTGGPIPIGFQVSRTDNTTQQNVAAGANRAPILHLSLRAINADVRVNTLAFDTQGSLPDPTAITGALLYRDADEDGTITSPDYLLSGPMTFAADNGRITFTNVNTVVSGNTTQKWVVAYQLAGSAPVGADFTLVLTNAEAVAAKYVNPINLDAPALGTFAIQSAQFTVTAAPAGQTFSAWQASVFSSEQLANPAISGPTADPDGDGVINLLEYAYNLNPLLADRDSASTTGGIPRATIITAFDSASGQQKPFLELTFVQRKPPVDLVYTMQQSANLSTWSDALGGSPYLVLQTTVDIDPPGTVQRVTYRSAQPIEGTTTKFIRVRVNQTP